MAGGSRGAGVGARIIIIVKSMSSTAYVTVNIFEQGNIPGKARVEDD